MRLQLAALSLAGAALGLRASAASGSKPSRRPQSPTNVTVWGLRPYLLSHPTHATNFNWCAVHQPPAAAHRQALAGHEAPRHAQLKNR